MFLNLLNLILIKLNLVSVVTYISYKNILRDVVLYFSSGRARRISKCFDYDQFVINTNLLNHIKLRMRKNRHKSVFFVLDTIDQSVVFTNNLFPYIFSNRFIVINSDTFAYTQFLRIITRIINSGIGSLVRELENRHMSDIALHMYDDTVQIRSNLSVFNIKLSQLEFGIEDIDTDHDFYIIKNINNIYFVIPVDRLFHLKEDTEDYIFITKDEYINNILPITEYFSPSDNIISYRDYRDKISDYHIA